MAPPDLRVIDGEIAPSPDERTEPMPAFDRAWEAFFDRAHAERIARNDAREAAGDPLFAEHNQRPETLGCCIHDVALSEPCADCHRETTKRLMILGAAARAVLDANRGRVPLAPHDLDQLERALDAIDWKRLRGL